MNKEWPKTNSEHYKKMTSNISESEYRKAYLGEPALYHPSDIKTFIEEGGHFDHVFLREGEEYIYLETIKDGITSVRNISWEEFYRLMKNYEDDIKVLTAQLQTELWQEYNTKKSRREVKTAQLNLDQN